MEKVEVSIHQHPLLPFTRFDLSRCGACWLGKSYIYGGYRCNELECESAFHKDCAESCPVINHSSHPDHPLKHRLSDESSSYCSRCGTQFFIGYFCLICDFKLDLRCANGLAPLLTLENSSVHEHPLELFDPTKLDIFKDKRMCKACDLTVFSGKPSYKCYQCELIFHEECAKFFPEANHTSHPQHPLKILTSERVPDYADKECLLCGIKFDRQIHHHCDVCNFSICRECMRNPPPLGVVSPTTHEHQLHLIPRRMDFTCNACGTQGDRRGPYFCLQYFNGFRYKSPNYGISLDVRCSSISEPFAHESHPHPLYYNIKKSCTACGEQNCDHVFSCDECDFSLGYKCSILPQRVIRHRYDDHPLFLSHGENNVDGEYWCEACETKLDPKKWFYTCIDCGITLHISCVVGDFSYIMPGSKTFSNEEVISNTSICRPLCIVCNNRCKLPSIAQISVDANSVNYFCSLECTDL